MTDFQKLGAALDRLGFEPKLDWQPSSTPGNYDIYKCYLVNLQDPNKMIHVAKTIKMSGLFERAMRWVLTKLAESTWLCKCIVDWANDKLALIGEEKLEAMFPEIVSKGNVAVGEGYSKTFREQQEPVWIWDIKTRYNQVFLRCYSHSNVQLPEFPRQVVAQL